jgi:hypothetical protein
VSNSKSLKNLISPGLRECMLGENGIERNRGGRKSIRLTHLVIHIVHGKISFIPKYESMKKYKMLVEFIAKKATED